LEVVLLEVVLLEALDFQLMVLGVNDILNQRKNQVHGIQQVREAEDASLVGLPENVISGLNKYVNI
jgi:hypothetical protein